MIGYFITGTDTDAGKTYTTCALIRYFQAQGQRVLPLKPVSSGGAPSPEGLVNEDALAMQRACHWTPPYEDINPYCAAPPIAPHIAMPERLVPNTIAKHCLQMAQKHRPDVMLVEGVGGWQVPMNAHDSFSDLAISLGLPVILVVGLRLGCLNHALLTYQAIQNTSLPIAGWVANHIDPDMAVQEENIHTLQTRIHAPLLATIQHTQTEVTFNFEAAGQ